MRPDDYRLQELHAAVKEFSNEETAIMAVPGTIRNSGKMVDAILVTIGHNPTKKKYDYVYRGLYSNFRTWLKEKVDEIKNK